MTNIIYWFAFIGLLQKFRNVTSQLGCQKGGPVADISRLSASHADYIVVIEVDPEIDSFDVHGHLDYTTKLSAS